MIVEAQRFWKRHQVLGFVWKREVRPWCLVQCIKNVAPRSFFLKFVLFDVIVNVCERHDISCCYDLDLELAVPHNALLKICLISFTEVAQSYKTMWSLFTVICFNCVVESTA